MEILLNQLIPNKESQTKDIDAPLCEKKQQLFFFISKGSVRCSAWLQVKQFQRGVIVILNGPRDVVHGRLPNRLSERQSGGAIRYMI